MKYSVALPILTILTTAQRSAADICLGACEVNESGDKTCIFSAKVDLHAGELGYYHFEECEGTNPTLGIEKSVTYKFVQGHISNYYHPLGLAYYPDGAHDDEDELEPYIEPPGSTSECYDSNTCPAPMYIRDGEYLGGYSNNDAIAPLVCGEEYCEEDFGLDVYETEFFLDPVTWKSAGIYEVALKFDVVDFTDDIFYFCHNHQFMTGRIKFVDSEGVALNAVDTPEIPYNYDSPSEYDQSCGTHGLGDYQLPNDQCPSTFVCNAPPESTPVGQFANCIDTMNCAMTVGMTTNVNQDNALALFIHQMIPHHQNAVNMCKALMASGEMYCDDITWEDTSDCNMSVLCYEIINDQNYQIQVMRTVLDNLTCDETDDCEVNISGGGASAAPSAVPPLAPTTNGDTIDSLRKTISDLEASSLATIESLEESIVQKDSIIANLSLQIENIGAGPVALPTEVPTAGPIAKQEKTSKKSKR